MWSKVVPSGARPLKNSMRTVDRAAFWGLQKWGWSGRCPPPLREIAGTSPNKGGNVSWVGGGPKTVLGDGVLWYAFPSLSFHPLCRSSNYFLAQWFSSLEENLPARNDGRNKNNFWKQILRSAFVQVIILGRRLTMKKMHDMFASSQPQPTSSHWSPFTSSQAQ